MEARAKAEAQGLSDQAREAQIKKVLDAEHTAARKKAAETEARLKGVVTALNRDLELSQLGAMNLQSEVAKCKEELLEKEAEASRPALCVASCCFWCATLTSSVRLGGGH